MIKKGEVFIFDYKKVTRFLNETTLIDFFFVGNLLRRYYLVPIIMFAISNPLGHLMFKTQNNIYVMEVYLAINNSPTKNTIDEISNLLGSKQLELSDIEILSMTDSWKFKTSVAAKLYQDPNFFDMSFSSVHSSKITLAKEQFNYCGGREDCIVRDLSKAVSSFYRFESQKDLLKVKLVVSSLNHYTTESLIKCIRKTLLEERVSYFKDDFTRKVALLQELVDKEVKFLETEGHFEVIEKQKKVEIEIKNVERSIASIEMSLDQQRVAMVAAESQLRQLKGSKKKVTDLKETGFFKSKKTMKERISDLQVNIDALKGIGGMKSEADLKVIAQLEEELRLTEEKYNSMGGDEEQFEFDQDFASSREKNTKITGMEFNVLKDKVASLEMKHKESIELHQKLIQEKIDLSKAEDHLRPRVTYLAQLESKLASSKLMMSSIIPDVKFDDINPDVSIFKRIGKTKYLIFVNVITFVLALFYLMIRYIMDKKIYDVNDIRHHFADLQIIGETPDFE